MFLSVQYRGKKFEIAAVVLDDGTCPAANYLEHLRSYDRASWKSMVSVLRAHADFGPLFNPEKSRPIKGHKGVFEFKSRQGDRVLYFYAGRRTILAHGFRKGAPAENEFTKAARLMNDYFREAGNVDY